MRRRWLTLIGGVAVLVIGIAWWFWPDRLTAEERPLVGTWRYAAGHPGTLTFTADHQYFHRDQGGNLTVPPGRWWVRDGVLLDDLEPSPIRRAFRPLLTRFGVRVWPLQSISTTAFEPGGHGGQGFIRVEPD